MITNDIYRVTGGNSNRTVAQYLCQGNLSYRDSSDATLGGGPLDAPIAIPAGSCNSTYAKNGLGKAIPYATEIERDQA